MKLIFLSLCLLLFLHPKAQIFENDFCGYEGKIGFKPWKCNSDYLTKFAEENNLQTNCMQNKILYNIPLTFWVYKDKTEEINYLDLKRLITELNYYYALNNTGLIFYLNDINIVNKSSRKTFSYMTEAPFITSLNCKQNSINVHLIDALQKKDFAKNELYYKGTYNNVNKSIILVKVNSDTGLAHEVGHFLGLKHPHKNYLKSKKKQESVSRERTKIKWFRKVRNCEVNGDCLCDTPAEPKLSKYVTADCKYQAIGVKDKWGDYYVPNTDNIMSYPTHKKCRNNFTEGQKLVMLYTAKKKKNSSKWKTDTVNNALLDVYEPDNIKEMYNYLSVNTTQIHTLHKNTLKSNIVDADIDIDWYCCIITDSLKNYTLNLRKESDKDMKIKIFVSDVFLKEVVLAQRDTMLNFNELSHENQSFFIQITASSCMTYQIEISK